jgi:hypothetical protein
MQCKYREFHNVCVGLDAKDVIQASWTCARCNKVYGQRPAESDESIFSEGQEYKDKVETESSSDWEMGNASSSASLHDWQSVIEN